VSQADALAHALTDAHPSMGVVVVVAGLAVDLGGQQSPPMVHTSKAAVAKTKTLIRIISMSKDRDALSR